MNCHSQLVHVEGPDMKLKQGHLKGRETLKLFHFHPFYCKVRPSGLISFAPGPNWVLRSNPLLALLPQHTEFPPGPSQVQCKCRSGWKRAHHLESHLCLKASSKGFPTSCNTLSRAEPVKSHSKLETVCSLEFVFLN